MLICSMSVSVAPVDEVPATRGGEAAEVRAELEA
jgi:hypothetical protein